MIKLEDEVNEFYEGKPIKIRVTVFKKKKKSIFSYFPFLNYCFNDYADYE